MLSAAAEEAVSLAGLLTSFAEAAAKVLPRLAGLRLAESTAQRATEAAGARLAGHRGAGRTLGPAADWPWHADATGRTCGYVSVDLTGVGQQGPGGAAADGRMVFVGQVFNPAPPGRAGPAGAARVLAGLGPLPGWGEQLRRQAAHVGLERAERWIGLTDGGAGLEELLRSNFNRADLVLILDFYHAAEHLNDLAKAWQPGEGARELAGQWCHQLKHEGGAALLATLEGLPLRGRGAAARERHRAVTGYVRNNVHRMDYPTYRANGWLIGSGHIEAACKAVVGQRLKGNGMRWGEDGANEVAHLRALFKSDPGQWEAFWAMAC